MTSDAQPDTEETPAVRQLELDLPVTEPCKILAMGGAAIFGYRLPNDVPVERDSSAVARERWNSAPPVHALLQTLAEAAKAFEPQLGSDMIHAALLSRQINSKTEYLRAFAELLRDSEFPLRGRI